MKKSTTSKQKKLSKKRTSESKPKALVEIYRDEILDTRIFVSNLFDGVPTLTKEHKYKLSNH